MKSSAEGGRKLYRTDNKIIVSPGVLGLEQLNSATGSVKCHFPAKWTLMRSTIQMIESGQFPRTERSGWSNSKKRSVQMCPIGGNS